MKNTKNRKKQNNKNKQENTHKKQKQIGKTQKKQREAEIPEAQSQSLGPAPAGWRKGTCPGGQEPASAASPPLAVLVLTLSCVMGGSLV